MTAPSSGILYKILVEKGKTVPVGEIIGVIAEPNDGTIDIDKVVKGTRAQEEPTPSERKEETTEEVIKGLVYPVPDSPHTLGIHLTRTLGEETLIGPSAVPVTDKDDYEIRTPREEFERGALAMIPDFNIHRIYPGYSGNRPKVYFHGELQLDFIIKKQEKGRIHLIGIESPGLT
jgi:pyruvate/2-oxoglutarate dehydrogenase complex dihydrolipoamide acyltransferase (E2) component